MRLCHFYYDFVENLLRDEFCHAVEEVCDEPIEHLNQEWELLQYATVEIVREAGVVRSI